MSNSTIASLIASKKPVASTPAVAEQDRFMLVIDRQVRDDLRDLCEELGQKQIKFASELFTVALQQAIAEVKRAKDEAKAETEKAKA